MPEGDTLHRIAQRLSPLIGQVVKELRLPRSAQRGHRVEGRAVSTVEARGKNLLIHFDGGCALHTHLRMNGRWRLFQRRTELVADGPSVSVVLVAGELVAVGFSIPVVRLLGAGASENDPLLGRLGPDLAVAEPDFELALARLRQLGDAALGDALLDQRALSGLGNVYKSELLFKLQLNPFQPVSHFADGELIELLDLASRWLRRNTAAPPGAMRVTRMAGARGGGRHYVYRRAGEHCRHCGARIQMRRQGNTRSTYFCPACQRVSPARTE